MVRGYTLGIWLGREKINIEWIYFITTPITAIFCQIFTVEILLPP